MHASISHFFSTPYRLFASALHLLFHRFRRPCPLFLDFRIAETEVEIAVHLYLWPPFFFKRLPDRVEVGELGLEIDQCVVLLPSCARICRRSRVSRAETCPASIDRLFAGTRISSQSIRV